jgi:hypothetical protein
VEAGKFQQFMGMGKHRMKTLILGILLAAALPEAVRAADDDQSPEQREAAQARAKDPLWKPVTSQVDLIQIGEKSSPGALRNFCLNGVGNILACIDSEIREYSPEGKLLKKIPLEIKPTVIALGADQTIFVGGEGKLLKLDREGKVMATFASPSAAEAVVIGTEVEEMVKEMAKSNEQPYEAELKKIKESLETRRSQVMSMAITDQDVFMTVPAPSDFTFRVYRLDHALQGTKLVVQKLRGCCGQMDVKGHDGKLWVAHNARHAVETLDRDGKQLNKFGKAGKVKASDFGGCCEPKNVRVLSNGDILAAESGPPSCIKRFSADGKFKEVVAIAEGTKGECVRMTVEMSADGKKYYLLDTTQDAIRVFAAKK